MDLDELLKQLDLDEPSDFEFFEHYADLVESNEYIPYDVFYTLLSQTPAYTLVELTNNYFDDLLENLPDDIVDIFTLLSTIQKCLMGLARESDDEEGRRLFCEELYRFRNFYSFDSPVHCLRKKDGCKEDTSICEALALCRLERLGEDSYDYDFLDCLDYEINEYRVHLTDILHDSGNEDQEYQGPESGFYEDSEEKDPFEEAYTVGLVDRENPVIDGDYEDAYE